MLRYLVKTKRDVDEERIQECTTSQLTEANAEHVEPVIQTPNDDDANVSANIILDEKNNNLIQKQLESSTLPLAFSLWKNINPWLAPNKERKAICTICTEACEKNLILVFDSHKKVSKLTWVDSGFCTWGNAAQRIKKHATSTLHIESAQALSNLQKTNVIQHLSVANEKMMKDNRTALRKIFSTIKVLSEQGLALRGADNDQNSHFFKILKARAEDTVELKSWLQRTSHKWLHHDIQNEILELMANQILLQILRKIKDAEFYSILLDETSVISRLEQVSICIRTVSNDFESSEFFIGFYSTSNTKAATLADIVKDVLLRHDLKLDKLRGQCYDGASNVSEKISGLQARLREEEPRALFVHCNAHCLNLVVQDGLSKIIAVRNFIGVVKDLINFVRDSPKRLALFRDLQSNSESDNPALAAYCPTRWVMRISSLKTVRANYKH